MRRGGKGKERGRKKTPGTVASSSSPSPCSVARRISPGTRPCAAPLPHPASSTGRPCRGREPINTSVRARGAADAAERGRARPSPGTRRAEFPTMGGVAGSVVVREWSPRDVWHRNRECDRGIKSRQSFSSRTRPSSRSLVRPSRARVFPPAAEGKEGRKGEKERNPESQPNVPSPLVLPRARLTRAGAPIYAQIVYLLHYLLYKGL